jgi:nucleotide-binding universal stress UspA family protein
VNDAAHLLTVEANKKLVMEDTGEAEKLLNPLVERAKAAGVAYSIHLVEGAPEALIPGFASQKECDIVVMCTDNDKDSAKLAMGGLSGRVFQNLGVPLVLVH